MSNPTELEKELYEALAVVVDEIRLPFEVTKGGMTLIRFFPKQVSQIETAFRLFSVIHDLELRQGKLIPLPDGEQRPGIDLVNS
jgi:hypothetical protein